MESYKNLGGDSNVAGYEIGDRYILVMFRTGAVYEYTYESAGVANIEQMKMLAVHGQGLNSFIQRVVRKSYSRRIR